MQWHPCLLPYLAYPPGLTAAVVALPHVHEEVVDACGWGCGCLDICLYVHTYSSYCQLFPSIQNLFHFLVILLKCETIFPTYLF